MIFNGPSVQPDPFTCATSQPSDALREPVMVPCGPLPST